MLTVCFRGQTDYEMYTWKGVTYSLSNTKLSLPNMKLYVLLKGKCKQQRDSFSYALLTWDIYCISGLPYLLGGSSFQKTGYYRIWYAFPLLLTNGLLKGHTIPYLVRNVWYLVVSCAVPLECIVWLLILSLWALFWFKWVFW